MLKYAIGTSLKSSFDIRLIEFKSSCYTSQFVLKGNFIRSNIVFISKYILVNKRTT